MRIPYQIPPPLVSAALNLTAEQGEAFDHYLPEPGAFVTIGGGSLAYSLQFSPDAGQTWGPLPEWASFEDRHFTGIAPALGIYHFQVIAANRYGETPSPFTLSCIQKD